MLQLVFNKKFKNKIMKRIVLNSRSFLILTTLLLGFGVISSCSNKREEKSRKSLIVGIIMEPDHGFDPTLGWGSYGSPLFQSTLLKYDIDFNIVNDIATNYETSEGGTVWTIQIRNDVKFSDSIPLTVDDVIYTFETAKNSKSLVDLTFLNKIEKMDNQTIRFVLNQPNSTFIYHLTSMGIVPKHAHNSTYKENPIGSGPFQMVEWTKGKQVIVKANPLYYDKHPFFDTITFVFLRGDAAFAAARAGTVDIINVSEQYARSGIEGMQLKALESVDNRGIVLPFAKDEGKIAENGAPIGNPVTSHKAIRQALNYAVDRQAMVADILEGHGRPAYTLVDHLPWWNDQTVITDHNLEKAAAILEEDGWLLQNDGIRQKGTLRAEFTVYYRSDDPLRQGLALAFAQQAKLAGIKVNVKGENWDKIKEQLSHANGVVYGWGSHNPQELYFLYSSKVKGQGVFNPNYYENSKVDEYLEKAMKSDSQESALVYWKKVQWDGETGTSVQGDAPWVWLVNLDHLYFVRNGLVIGNQKIQPHSRVWAFTDFITDWHWEN